MSERAIEVQGLTLGPMQSNCYLVRTGDAARAVVVDPGAEPSRIIDALEAWGSPAAAVVLTHAHLDHVAGVPGVVDRFEVPVYLHPDDRPLYDAAPDQAASFGLSVPELPPPDHELEHGATVAEAGLELEVRHAPGHSPGGVVLAAPGHAFVGDCVFAGSVGRVDLPGGDGETLLRSIREQILTLPAETVLWPGHGPRTTVEREESTNPFLTGALGWG